MIKLDSAEAGNILRELESKSGNDPHSIVKTASIKADLLTRKLLLHGTFDLHL